MKEAPNSPYSRCIFREVFSDEQSVRRNGGVLSLEEITNIWSSTRGKIE